MQKKFHFLATLTLLLAVALTGCASASVTKPEDVKSTSGGSAAPKAPAEKVGTRSNPAPAGTSVTVKDVAGSPTYTVVIGAVNMDAGAQVAADNQFNEPAKPGTQYIIIPVTFTYIGKETGTPGSDVNVNFVSAAGTTHRSSDVNTVVNNDINSLNELYPGATGSGNVVIEVPSADITKGLLTIGSLFGNDKFFIKLA